MMKPNQMREREVDRRAAEADPVAAPVRPWPRWVAP